MENLSCAFFGHRDFNYKPYETDIREAVEDLIIRGVTKFYNVYSGQFDRTCARIVSELKTDYPHIKNIMVLSCAPKGKFEKPALFDEAVYLQQEKSSAKCDVTTYVNRKVVETVDYVISGIARGYGDSKFACDYAKELCKSWYDVVTDEEEFWSGQSIAREVAQIEKNYAKELDHFSKRLKEEVIPQVNESLQSRKVSKRRKDDNPPVWITVEAKK